MLNEINSNNVLRVIDDYDLESKGYKISYVFDAYDVIFYCFPSLRSQSIGNGKIKDDLIDNFLAYHFFFFEYAKAPILPSEYILELLHFKSKSNYNIREVKSLNQRVADLLGSVNMEYGEDYRSLLEFCRKNIKLIAAFLAGKYNSNSIDEFEKILKISPNSYFESNNFYSTSPDNDLINRYVVDQVFDDFKKIVNRKIKRKSIEDKFLYYESVYRDIEVACKVINSNKRSIASGNKDIYLFTSSTPVRSKLIFGIFEKLGFFPSVEGIDNFPILRNKKELYLKFLFYKYSNDHLERKDLLNELLQIAVESEEINSDDQSNIEKYKVFDLMSENSRLNVESNLILSQLELMPSYLEMNTQLENRIMKFSSHDENKFNDLKKFFEELHSLIEDTDFKEFTHVSVQEHYLSYRIRNDLNEIINSHSPILRNIKGKDIIRGTYHHLPLLLFYEREMDDEIQAIIASITKKCVLSSGGGKIEISEDVLDLINKFYIRYGYSKESSIEVVLIKVFLLLLIPLPKDKKKENENKDSELIDACLTLMNVSRKLKNNSLKREYNYEVDIFYLLTWLYRRELNFDSSILISSDGIEKYPNSPRLFHGLGLSYLAKYYDIFYLKGNYSSGIDLLEKSKQAIDKSYELYSVKRDKNSTEEIYNDNVSLILNKTISAVLNTLAVISAKLYQSKKDDGYLILARSYIKKIRDENLKNNSDEFSILSEYNHTEADIEYLEASRLFEMDKRDEAIEKISFAEGRINQAISLNSGSTYSLIEITKSNIENLKLKLGL